MSPLVPDTAGALQPLTQPALTKTVSLRKGNRRRSPQTEAGGLALMSVSSTFPGSKAKGSHMAVGEQQVSDLNARATRPRHQTLRSRG